MKIRNFLLALAACGLLATWSCSKGTSNNPAPGKPGPAWGDAPTAMPEKGFNALITVVDPPVKLRTGQQQTIQVKVKNASDVLWYARGARANPSSTNKFYLAVADRWLASDGKTLVTDMDGRYGLPHDLKPGQETAVPLLITAPKEPGDYFLDLDLVQEGVAWFHDKGSPTASVKIKVER
jgi:hypothetical protein